MNGTNKELVGVYSFCTPISSIYQGQRLVWCKELKFNEDDVVFEVDTTYSKTVYLPINGATNISLGSVDWGDGTVEDVVITMPSFTRNPMKHTYTNNGKYIVTFTPNGTDFSITDSDSKDSLAFTKVYSFGSKYPTNVRVSKANHFNSFQKHYPFKDGICRIENIQQDSINLDGLFSELNEVDGYVSGTFAKLEGNLLGAKATIHNLDYGIIRDCPNLVEIENIDIPNETVNGIINNCPKITKIHSVTYPINAHSSRADVVLFGTKNTPSNVIRELTFTNLSDFSAYSLIDFRSLSNWGINNNTCTNAKQSVIDSFITNATLREKPLSLYLPDKIKDALTDSEKAQITNKGFTIV